MIGRIKLTNFRQHADVEVDFDPAKQLVAITGNNGVGKTSLLEAISYALHGESRYGRANLDRLVRRGAEYEGMEVELEFTVHGSTYTVVRRRDGKASTAVLYGNGVALVESPVAVTAEITRLIGMDSAGFRAAVVANQGDLAGITSLQPARRRKLLTRLLRLDEVARARDAARGQYRDHRGALLALGDGPDLDQLTSDLATAERAAERAAAAADEAATQVAELTAALDATEHVEQRWHDTQTRLTQAQARIDQLDDQLRTSRSRLGTLTIPDVDDEPRARAQIDEQRRQVAADLATARQLAATLARLNSQRDQLAGWLDEHGHVDLDGANRRLTDATAAFEPARTLREQLAGQVATCRGRDAELQARLDGLAGTEGTCDACGQPVDAEHLAEHRTQLEADLGQLRDQLATLQARQQQAAEHEQQLLDAVQVARRQVAEASGLVSVATERRTQLAAVDEQLAEVRTQAGGAGDVDELTARAGRLDDELARRDRYDRQVRARENAESARDQLLAQIQQFADELDLARTQHEQAAPAPTLVAAWQARQQQAADLQRDQARLAQLRSDAALAAQKVTHAKALLDSAVAQRARRTDLESRAQVCSVTAEVLDAAHAQLSTQLRPVLQATVSDLLARMSGGRFTSVQVTADYDVLVADGDREMPLTEFSGGEQDLIALAVRLALADVVADRHGGGAGFLILDEPLGSQDSQRRDAIVLALRALRDLYGQILLISHVGGIEDAADQVVEIGVAVDDDGQRTTEVTVL